MRPRRPRARLALALAPLLALLLALAGCSRSPPPPPPPPPPSDGSPGSAGVPVMGLSRLTAEQLVAYYQRYDPGTLPYRAAGVTPAAARADVRRRGQSLQRARRHRVRAVDRRDGVVLLPRLRAVRPTDNNFAGHRRVRLVRQRLRVQRARWTVCARSCSCCATTPTSARASRNIPDPPVPELWGSTPATANYNFDHYFAKGDAPLWNDMGNGNWATAPNYNTVDPERLQPDAHVQRSPGSVPARRPALRCRSPRPDRAR